MTGLVGGQAGSIPPAPALQYPGYTLQYCAQYPAPPSLSSILSLPPPPPHPYQAYQAATPGLQFLPPPCWPPHLSLPPPPAKRKAEEGGGGFSDKRAKLCGGS